MAKWKYALTSVSETSKTAATRFGWENKVPLLGRVIPRGESAQKNMPVFRSILNLNAPNLLLVNARPLSGEAGVMLHLREVEGQSAIVDMDRLLRETKMKAAYRVNVLGGHKEAISDILEVKAFGTQFVLLKK